MSKGKTQLRKIAIIHDWLTAPGGAERVLQQMLIAFPTADVFTICDSLATKHRYLLEGKEPKCSFIQRMPFSASKHWLYLPLMPIAIEQLDLSAYDLILSSSYAVAKGVITGPDQTHVSYVHTPIRYAWNLQHQYLQEMNLDKGPLSMIARCLLHYLRMWDLRSAVGVDRFVANSAYVARQVEKLYKQPCSVLHPPVDLERFPVETQKDDYYVTASRLVPYKRIDLIVKAFAQMPQRKLVVIGDGPEMNRVRAAADGHANIELMGYQPDAVLSGRIAKAKAFVFAAIEDFGIAPVEAQACGTPVIALGKGGALETVRPIGVHNPTGLYFSEQTEESLIAAVEEFDQVSYLITPANCRKNAEEFASERFRRQLVELVEGAVRESHTQYPMHGPIAGSFTGFRASGDEVSNYAAPDSLEMAK